MEKLIDGIKYSLVNGVASILRQERSLSGDIAIPDRVTYKDKSYTVKRIVAGAFKYARIESIALPDSITTLPNECFFFCTSLLAVILPEDLTTLGENCFTGCTSLNIIDLPEGVTSLGDFCFAHCTDLESITLPSTIRSLGKGCFFDCDSLVSITLPSTITSLEESCFGACYNLSKVICEWRDLDKVKIGYFSFETSELQRTLYVPKGTKSMYEAKEQWRGFQEIVEYDDSELSE